MGPFHTTVLQSERAFRKIEQVSGPWSSPIHPSGMLSTETTSVLASLSNLSAITTSVGSSSSTPLALAVSSSFAASSRQSFSTMELPMPCPLALRKVKIMPPETRTFSHLSMRDSRTVIFVDTLAPPTIAAKGRTGEVTAEWRKAISFSRRRPLTAGAPGWRAFICSTTPAVDECARWAVPKASLTYAIAPVSLASRAEKASSFLVSPAWNRRFSKRTTSPPLMDWHAFLTDSPMQSLTAVTGLPRC
mmetsp:Transcript_12830/g.17830  ORF Transcript_12830/g.17830 Transcript_12830/m.17830 type:complete len:247 (+) Transcript_12830:553-1293(+)